MRVDDQEMRISDLIKMEMETCYPRTELTFKLIGLMHYLDSDTKWMNDQGMQWDMSRLIAEEMRQPIRGAACGGTHRLEALVVLARADDATGALSRRHRNRIVRHLADVSRRLITSQHRDGYWTRSWTTGAQPASDTEGSLYDRILLTVWL